MALHLINGRFYEERDGAFHPINALQAQPQGDFASRASAMPQAIGYELPRNVGTRLSENAAVDQAHISTDEPSGLPAQQGNPKIGSASTGAQILGPSRGMKFRSALATAPRRTVSPPWPMARGGSDPEGKDVWETFPSLAPTGTMGQRLTPTSLDETRGMPAVYLSDGGTPAPQMMPVKLGLLGKTILRNGYNQNKDIRKNIKDTFEKIAGRKFTEVEIKTILGDVANGKSTTLQEIMSLDPEGDGKFTREQISTITTYVNELPDTSLNKNVRSGWNSYLEKQKVRK